MHLDGETLLSKSPGPLCTENSDDPVAVSLTETTASAEQIEAALAVTHSSDACLALAGTAEAIGANELQRRCLEQAVALDRNCQAALLTLAAQSLDANDASLPFVLLEETARAGLLPADVAPLHRELCEQAASDVRLESYLRLIGRVAAEKPTKTLSVVLVTNLFPPQELGGYGRMMWEFAQGLVARGHAVRILTSDATEFGKNPTPDEAEMEQHVSRTLKLLGTWKGGRPAPVTDNVTIARYLRDNANRVREAVSEAKADLLLAGNLDFLGIPVIRPALAKNIPVLHALANAGAGYPLSEQPKEAHYWVAPCSDWNGVVFKEAGYTPQRVETLYPGARIDRFFRFFLPDTRRLRICYASLVLPYKGVDTLVRALGRLHQAGVEFTAEIAGDAPDVAFLDQLRDYVRSNGMEGKVQFTGFLDRRGLSALFARSNVLVFPSRFQEPFGISQVEALAAGLVVVSSGTGGAKEIIRDRTDGLLFTPGSDSDLAGKLLDLARNPELMARLQRSGQSRAMTFSVENAVKKIETLAGEMQAAAAARVPVRPVAPSVQAADEVVKGRTFLTQGDPAKALSCATTALEKDPASFDAHVLMAEIALAQPGRAALAEKSLRQALELRPRDAAVARLLATALSHQERLGEAEVVLKNALEARPHEANLLLALANLREKLKDFAGAESALRAAAKYHAEQPAIAEALGHLLKRRGHLNEALICHRRAAGCRDSQLPALRPGRRRALFLVQFGPSWSGMASAYAAFKADPEWDVTVVALPFLQCQFKTDEERNAVFEFLSEQGIPHVSWKDFELKPGCADVAFLSLPYDETLPGGWRLRDFLRCAPRLTYLPYNLVMLGGTENTRFQFDLVLQRVAWMVVAHSQRSKAMFARHCATGDNHVVITGHPKIDAVRDRHLARDPELTRFAAGRKLVCWNPHFDLRPDGTFFGAGPSTFLGWHKILLEEFARRQDMAFVIRPHPLFFSALESRRLWSAEQVAEFFQQVERAGNVQIDRRPSYLPVFAEASALLSDASSLLLEFSVTGNPVLYLRNPHGPGLNEDGEFVDAHQYTAERQEEIFDFLDMVARGDDPRGPARAKALGEFVHQAPEGAAAALKQAVTERLAAEMKGSKTVQPAAR